LLANSGDRVHAEDYVEQAIRRQLAVKTLVDLGKERSDAHVVPNLSRKALDHGVLEHDHVRPASGDCLDRGLLPLVIFGLIGDYQVSTKTLGKQPQRGTARQGFVVVVSHAEIVQDRERDVTPKSFCPSNPNRILLP
jgi:predicted amino acid-binding ACT domain protein